MLWQALRMRSRIAWRSGASPASRCSAASACGRKLSPIKSAIHWAQARYEIVFRAKIIGDSGDILPGLGGDIAGGGVLAVLAKLGDSGRDKLIFACSPLLVIALGKS